MSNHPSDSQYACNQFLEAVSKNEKARSLPMSQRGGPAAQALRELDGASVTGIFDQLANRIQRLISRK